MDSKFIYPSDSMITKEQFTAFQTRLEIMLEFNIPIDDLISIIPYRQLAYLKNAGVLFFNLENDQLKKIDFIDYCWIYFLNIARKYGMSIESIAIVKNALSKTVDWLVITEDERFEKLMQVIPEEHKADFLEFIKDRTANTAPPSVRMSRFYLIIIDCLISMEPLSILINPNLEIVVFKENGIDEYYNNPGFLEFYAGSYLKISINEIIWNFIGNDLESIDEKRLTMLSRQELEIINAIRLKNVDEVAVKFNKNQKPELIKITETKRVETNARLYEIIKANSYEEISIKTQDGKISEFKSTRKIKIS